MYILWTREKINTISSWFQAVKTCSFTTQRVVFIRKQRAVPINSKNEENLFEASHFIVLPHLPQSTVIVTKIIHAFSGPEKYLELHTKCQTQLCISHSCTEHLWQFSYRYQSLIWQEARSVNVLLQHHLTPKLYVYLSLLCSLLPTQHFLGLPCFACLLSNAGPNSESWCAHFAPREFSAEQCEDLHVGTNTRCEDLAWWKRI